MVEETKKKEISIKSIEKALSIMECYSRSDTSLSLTAISQRANIPLSTTSRFVSALVHTGFLEKEEKTKHYMLGSKLYYLGMLARAAISLRQLALPFMEDLCKEYLETVNLFVRVDDTRVCYEQIESPMGLRRSARLGEAFPLWAGATGRCFLLQENMEERRRIFEQSRPITTNTITDFDAFNELIKEIGKQGYGVSHGEREEGVVAIAAPILDGSEKIIASIAISLPSVRSSTEKITLMGESLRETARRISGKLGFGRYTGEGRFLAK